MFPPELSPAFDWRSCWVTSGFDEFEFEVFNRWGTTVWLSNDPNQPWDGGDYSSGSGQHFLPDGVYPYVVNWKHTDDGQQFVESRVGRILIIR